MKLLKITNLFKKEQPAYKSGAAQTPYQRAQTEWDERIGSARYQAKNWRIAAFASFITMIFLLILLIITITTKKEHLFVAEVTQTGRIVNVAPLTVGYNPTAAQQQYFIAQFIELIRNVPLDPVMAKQNWLKAYQFLSDRGATQLTAFFRTQNPSALIGKKTVTTKINDINALSGNSFQINWTETTTNMEGQIESEKHYSGVFSTITRQPKTQQEILQNPLGIHIVDFHITQREL